MLRRIVLDIQRAYVWLDRDSSPLPLILRQGGGYEKETKNNQARNRQKIIKSPDPRVPEKAEVQVHEADELYREIRIDNELEDEGGKKVKLKEDAPVDITVEADKDSTT